MKLATSMLLRSSLAKLHVVHYLFSPSSLPPMPDATSAAMQPHFFPATRTAWQCAGRSDNALLHLLHLSGVETQFIGHLKQVHPAMCSGQASDAASMDRSSDGAAAHAPPGSFVTGASVQSATARRQHTAKDAQLAAPLFLLLLLLRVPDTTVRHLAMVGENTRNSLLPDV